MVEESVFIDGAHSDNGGLNPDSDRFRLSSRRFR